MRLINVKTYELQEFHDENEVEYAILSHRREQEEILFKDMTSRVDLSNIRAKKGWYKIQQCCRQAQIHGLGYVWVDTCCIDKSSSAELRKAINSMFRWYANALVCYVYLSNVDVSKSTFHYTDSSYGHSRFTSSKWFQRGWTLQELLAPGIVSFHDVEWTYIGSRKACCEAISRATGIPTRNLAEGLPPVEWRPCVAEIMSWASGGATTRLEDRAYSLLGLFDVNMPLMYGEREKAFIRLQEEILRYSDDQSIFAWRDAKHGTPSGFLAFSADCFGPAILRARTFVSPQMFPRRQPHTVTNEGILVELELVPLAPRLYGARLNAQLANVIPQEGNWQVGGPQASIYLGRLDVNNRYVRTSRVFACSVANDLLSLLERGEYGFSRMRQVTMVRSTRRHEADIHLAKDLCAFPISQLEYRARRAVSPQPLRSTVELYGGIKVPVDLILWSEHMHCLTAMIKLKDQEWAASPWRASVFSTIALGFDFDFNPLCVLSLKNTKCLQWDAYKEIVQAGTPWRRDINFSAESSTFGFPFTWEASWGCEWRAHSGVLLVIRMDLDNRDNNRGFSSCFCCQTKHSITAIVQLGMARPDPEHPWQFSCTVT